MSRSRRNSESLEREFEAVLKWHLTWSLKLGSSVIRSKSGAVEDSAAEAYWSDVVEPQVRNALHQKGVMLFDISTFKVVVKSSRCTVRKVDYISAVHDWAPLNKALKS